MTRMAAPPAISKPHRTASTGGFAGRAVAAGDGSIAAGLADACLPTVSWLAGVAEFRGASGLGVKFAGGMVRVGRRVHVGWIAAVDVPVRVAVGVVSPAVGRGVGVWVEPAVGSKV